MQEPAVAQPPHGLMGLEPPPLWMSWFWPVLLLAFILFLGLLLYLWKRRRNRVARQGPPPRDEWIELVERLQQLPLPRTESAAEAAAFYEGLSAGLRAALERRFTFAASSQTLPELKAELSRLSLSLPAVARQSEYEAFLDRADRILFAGYREAPSAHEQWRQEVIAWVQELSIKRESPEATS